jgi:hypothetical protein
VVKAIRLISTLPSEAAAALKATFLDGRHYGTLLGGADADVYKPDGSPLLLFRHRALPAWVCEQAYPDLWRAARSTSNRGTAAGAKRPARVKRDGTLSRTTYAEPVESGVIGYFDRNARFPYCRTTAYTARQVGGWARVQPFIRAVNAVFRTELSDRYEAQLAAVRQTPPDYVIRGTVFTTVTVNRNYVSAVHKDQGDLPEGFGVMSVLRAGEYEGGFLCFPSYRVAVDMRTRDVLLADVHEWHGNTPIVGAAGGYERVSCVFYFRTGMRHCLPPEEELRHAKRRRPGDPLCP